MSPHIKNLGPGGKDKVIFVTKEDHQKPSTVKLPEPDVEPGLILPNGDINWSCPCLGGMPTGPCGVEFRSTFSCLHNSSADPKGSDCVDVFAKMHDCMKKYPTLYKKVLGDDDDFSALEAEGQNKSSPPESVTSKEKET